MIPSYCKEAAWHLTFDKHPTAAGMWQPAHVLTLQSLPPLHDRPSCPRGMPYALYALYLINNILLIIYNI